MEIEIISILALRITQLKRPCDINGTISILSLFASRELHLLSLWFSEPYCQPVYEAGPCLAQSAEFVKCRCGISNPREARNHSLMEYSILFCQLVFICHKSYLTKLNVENGTRATVSVYFIAALTYCWLFSLLFAPINKGCIILKERGCELHPYI